MNYRPIHNARFKNRLNGLFIAAVAVFLAIFYFFYPSFLAAAALKMAAPFLGAKNYMAEEFYQSLYYFKSKKSLIHENERLKNDLNEMREMLSDRNILSEENKDLRKQLNRREQNKEEVLGAVLSAPPQSIYDTVILDIGEKDGIRVGDYASKGQILIGSVVKVYGDSSVIKLFSTAGERSTVSILHDGTSIQAEAIGQGNGEFTATIPREVPIATGDSVVMPGLNPLLFAEVEAIEKKDSDSFQHIRFKNPVSIQTIRTLQVIKSPSPETI